MFDSGCTHHMTGEKELLERFIDDVNRTSYITFGDNTKQKVLDVSPENVMLVESLGYNLLSINNLTNIGYDCYFTKDKVMVFRSDNLKLVFVGHTEVSLYVADFSQENPSSSLCLMAKVDKGWLWHRRLGHVNMRNLKLLLKDDHVIGLTDVDFERDRVCSACIAGKQKGKAHPSKSIVTTFRPLELLHLDLFGPSNYDTLGGKKFGLVIVDDYSRYTWVFFLKSKDETQKCFIDFATQSQRQYDEKIKAIRTDNGTEFKNYTMQDFVDGKASSINTLHLTHPNKMVLWRGRTRQSLRWQELC